MRGVRALVVVALVASVARAEGVGEKPGSNPSRLNGAATLRLTPDGGAIGVGGSSLRRLGPGARAWETLHRQEGDGISRVEVDDRGRVLAVWEKDPFIHYFTPSPKQHIQIPKPVAPYPMSLWYVGQLIFMPNGRDALVYMSGVSGSNGDRRADEAYRIALDGKSEPEVLFRADGGHLLHVSRHGAVYLMPKNPGKQRCDHSSGCFPVAAIIAYEITEKGVVQKTLVDGEQVVMRSADMVYAPGWSTDQDRVTLLVGLQKNEQALLRWRYGNEKPDYRPFHKFRYDTEMKMTSTGDLIELVVESGTLEVRRYPLEGSEQLLAKLPLLQDVDSNVHGVGERGDGSLWVHWGDHLALLAPGKPARSYDLEPLLERRTEWAGTAVYVKSPEAVWVGIDRRGGRDFVRLSFAEIDRRAKPWPAKGIQ